MYEKVLKAISQQLTAPGNCPYDESCVYSETTCTAPNSYILRARDNYLERSKEKNSDHAYGGFMMGGSNKDFSDYQWPCTSFVAILFASPSALEKRRETEQELETRIIENGLK